ncbi:hypothetical protein [Methylocaldum sp. 14B]|jgi:hypothetical protein|uniref:hypothetical protein n=1 Tax=Methylocaldum sp. 14B TaxID=1912213 RepID=UPI00098A1C7C|nr:hypothetical protein [Methylocaldum sp. 14B]
MINGRTNTPELTEASDLLSQSRGILELLQTLTLIPDKNQIIELSPGAAKGLFFLIEDVDARILKAVELIDQYRAVNK